MNSLLQILLTKMRRKIVIRMKKMPKMTKKRKMRVKMTNRMPKNVSANFCKSINTAPAIIDGPPLIGYTMKCHFEQASLSLSVD